MSRSVLSMSVLTILSFQVPDNTRCTCKAVEQIRRVFDDNLGILLHISPEKRMLWVLIRIASTRRF